MQWHEGPLTGHTPNGNISGNRGCSQLTGSTNDTILQITITRDTLKLQGLL